MMHGLFLTGYEELSFEVNFSVQFPFTPYTVTKAYYNDGAVYNHWKYLTFVTLGCTYERTHYIMKKEYV